MALQLVHAHYCMAIPCDFRGTQVESQGCKKNEAMTFQWEPQRFLQDGSLFNNMFYLKVAVA